MNSSIPRAWAGTFATTAVGAALVLCPAQGHSTPQQGGNATNPLAQVGPRTEAVSVSGYLDRTDPHQLRYVSAATGSDQRGDGSRDRPWASVHHALAAIQDARLSNRYAVLVAEGTYADGTIALKPFVDLWGGFDRATWARDIHRFRTVLDGEEGGRVVIAADSTRLDGFTLTRGAVRGPGGAILADGASPLITNNTFLSNRTLQPKGWDPEFLHTRAHDGGAIAALNGAAPTIRNNLFAFNSTETGRGAAIAAHNRAAPRIAFNVIVQNTAGTNDPMRSSDGGAVSAVQVSRPEILHNVIAGNRAIAENDGGGVFAELWSPLVLHGNVIAGNYADDDGGGLFLAGQQHHYITELDPVPPAETYHSVIRHNVFMGNATSGGDDSNHGVMRVTNDARVTLEQNRIAFNRGGLDLRRSDVTARHNTIAASIRVEESKRPPVLINNALLGELLFESDVVVQGSFHIASAQPASAVAEHFVADGDRLAVRDTHVDEARVTTTLQLAAPLAGELRPGRVLRAGGDWAVVRSAAEAEIVVWGQLDDVPEVELMPTLKPAPGSPIHARSVGYGSTAGAGPNDADPFAYLPAGSWGRLPDGRTWGAVIGVFPDSKGNIWVFERCGANTCLGSELDPILKFDADGNLLASFGGGMFAWPHGFYVDHEDNIWATDASGHWLPDAERFVQTETGKGHTVVKFSPQGEVLLTLGEPGVPGSGPSRFHNPSDVAVASNGDIFVVDGHKPDGNNRVVKFAPDGTYIKEWGTRGIAPGEFDDPHAIAIDARGRVFIGDRINNRIQIFDQDGNFLEQWTQFGRPSGIFIDDRDAIYVSDSESNASRNPGWARGVRIGNAHDGWVRHFIPDTEPNPDGVGTSGAEFIAADAHGNVYLGEVGPRDLKKFLRTW